MQFIGSRRQIGARRAPQMKWISISIFSVFTFKLEIWRKATQNILCP